MGPSDGGDTETPEQKLAARWNFLVSQQFQHILDKSTPHILHRWIALIALGFIYAVRVYFVQGFYVVSYALGIYLLNLLIGFLSPQVDPLQLDEGPTLPTLASDEFRPFVRRLPEFKFWYDDRCAVLGPQTQHRWLLESPDIHAPNPELQIDGELNVILYSITKAVCIAFVMTFFDVFDVPVFWPILLFYWFVLFTLTMRRQIHHMIKYKYVPFSIGKKSYGQKRQIPEENTALVRD